jgi:hypothetical protein
VIEGQITLEGTTEGISEALVTLSLDRTPSQIEAEAPNTKSRAVAQSITDGGGRFGFKDLPEGNYRISVTADGFSRRQYGQKVSNGVGRALPLQRSQTISQLVMELVPAAAVTGRITDGIGRPVVNVPVTLLRPRHTAKGKIHAVVATTKTDDRGLYRLFGIAPGRYLLGAGDGPSPTGFRPVAPANGPPPIDLRYAKSYAPTFYPGVFDLDSASPVDLTAGAETPADM